MPVIVGALRTAAPSQCDTQGRSVIPAGFLADFHDHRGRLTARFDGPVLLTRLVKGSAYQLSHWRVETGEAS